jgi:hypothetical protein
MMKRFNKMSLTDRLLSANNGGELLYTMTIPVVISVDSKQYRVTTTIRMTRVLLAVRLYWLDHGKLPVTLDDLVPGYLKSVPLDAYDGKPLRYSPANKVIYSVGKELMDKGGDISDGNKDGDRQPTVKIEW